METTVLIPRVLQSYAAGQARLTLHGNTIRAILADLSDNFPALYGCICNETGAIRQHINLFINNDFLIDRGGLDAPLQAGDIVSVFQAVSGG